jgi:hypothetical protein
VGSVRGAGYGTRTVEPRSPEAAVADEEALVDQGPRGQRRDVEGLEAGRRGGRRRGGAAREQERALEAGGPHPGRPGHEDVPDVGGRGGRLGPEDGGVDGHRRQAATTRPSAASAASRMRRAAAPAAGSAGRKTAPTAARAGSKSATPASAARAAATSGVTGIASPAPSPVIASAAIAPRCVSDARASSASGTTRVDRRRVGRSRDEAHAAASCLNRGPEAHRGRPARTGRDGADGPSERPPCGRWAFSRIAGG